MTTARALPVDIGHEEATRGKVIRVQNSGAHGGYSIIPHSIRKIVMRELRGASPHVLSFVWERTVAFRKFEAEIPFPEFVENICYCERSIRDAMSLLDEKGWLTVRKNGSRANIYGIAVQLLEDHACLEDSPADDGDSEDPLEDPGYVDDSPADDGNSEDPLEDRADVDDSPADPGDSEDPLEDPGYVDDSPADDGDLENALEDAHDVEDLPADPGDSETHLEDADDVDDLPADGGKSVAAKIADQNSPPPCIPPKDLGIFKKSTRNTPVLNTTGNRSEAQREEGYRGYFSSQPQVSDHPVAQELKYCGVYRRTIVKLMKEFEPENIMSVLENYKQDMAERHNVRDYARVLVWRIRNGITSWGVDSWLSDVQGQFDDSIGSDKAGLLGVLEYAALEQNLEAQDVMAKLDVGGITYQQIQKWAAVDVRIEL